MISLEPQDLINDIKNNHDINNVKYNHDDNNIIKKDIKQTKGDNKDDQLKKDKRTSLILFLLGFIFWVPFLINLRYIKSSNNYIKSLSIASLVIGIIEFMLLVPTISFILYALIDAKRS